MHLHQNDFRLDLGQNLFNQQEGIVRAVVHVAAANQVDDRHIPRFALIHAPALSRHLGRIVGRAQNPAVFVQIVAQFPLAEGVIPHGNHICARVKNLLRLPGRHTHNRGIFPVDDGKIRPRFPLQIAQAAADPVKAGIAHHISHAQYLQNHGHSPISFSLVYTRFPNDARKNPCTEPMRATANAAANPVVLDMFGTTECRARACPCRWVPSFTLF